ncbi:ion channel DMI1-like [Klebsormidium nitens]|uniref:Ion channel DMI1-like n=1 Tax=Klebsormidium nitens TaxID=105231 RepID=A0A1Y1IUV5_KLENI|nr:ion channel DMI1-like [Klebsormidium nitens]|eukprot:GAQ92636.1 ion channel DMI1-like [Klebsormidium nitens]
MCAGGLSMGERSEERMRNSGPAAKEANPKCNAMQLQHAERECGPAQCKDYKRWSLLDWGRLLGAVAIGVVLSLQVPVAGGGRGQHALAASTASVSSRFVQIPIQRAPLKMDKGDITLGERAIYLLDYFYSTEPWSKTLILLVITGLLTTIGGMAYYNVAREDPEGSKDFREAFWASWTFVADPGTHAGEDTWQKRLVAVPLTIGGMLFFALLIGLVSDAVSSKVDGLQKGASIVIEKHHTLVVGWTPKTVPLVEALSIANTDRKHKKTIVVLGEKEKEDMDAELLDSIPVSARGGTKVISRQGVATSLEDLRRCSADGASSIVVLSPTGGSQNPDRVDAEVLQTCLVLAHLPNMHANIIAEFAELDNVEILKEMHRTLVKKSPIAALPEGKESAVPAEPSLEEDGNGSAKGRSRKMVPIAAGDVASRMLVYRALEPDLAFAMDELLTFEKNEFRFKEWPELVGKTFAEAVFMFKDAIPCGLRRRHVSDYGRRKILVNPAPDTVIEKGDRLLVISRGDDTYRPGASEQPGPIGLLQPSKEKFQPYTKLLLCGWKNDMYDLLSLLDCIAAPGSEVHMMSEASKHAREHELATGPRLKNLKIKQLYGNPGSRQDLCSLPLEEYDRVILLTKSGGEETCVNNLDVSTTTTAMYIRHAQVERGNPGCTIVAELRAGNSDGLELVQKAWLDDYIVPGAVEARVLANLAEDTDVGAVLDEVVSDYGSNLNMQQASAYVRPGEVVSFFELQRRAMAQRDLVLGYRNRAAGGEWVLNPPEKHAPLQWTEEDRLVVLDRGL